MGKKKNLTLLCCICMLLFINSSVFSISSSVKSQKDYIFTLSHLRNLRIIISNFASKEFSAQEIKSEYDKTESLFKKNATEYYGLEYTEYNEETKKHQARFYEVKRSLNDIFRKLALLYTDRTKVLLDDTSSESFKILLTYGRRRDLVQYFNKPIDPLRESKKKPYSVTGYHFFRDKQKIENYLKEGYKNHKKALLIMEYDDHKLIQSKKVKTSRDLNYLINRYYNVIINCRLAKQYGIEIFKILEMEKIEGILKKYRLRSHSDIVPIFDDRIPEKFKVDANDNIGLMHKDQLMKLPNFRKK